VTFLSFIPLVFLLVTFDSIDMALFLENVLASFVYTDITLS
jgi:hypothetical protein